MYLNGLAKELYELCGEIENLPASEQQTACIVKAGGILHGPYADPNNYVAWLKFVGATDDPSRHLELCDSDAVGAFKVRRS